MLDLSDPLTKVRVTCGICTGIAILTTLLRNLVWICRSELWVDDGLAIFSMLALIVQLVAVFIDPNESNGTVRYYLISNMFYAAIWSARLSILFSIIRISRPFRSYHYLFVIAAAFAVAWVLLTAQIYWECEKRTAWKHLAIPQCRLSCAVAICQLVTDIISDGLLLFVPIRLFITIQEKRLRYRLTVIFGTCIITTIVSFVHTAFLFEVKATPILISAVIENAVSLIVCNIPVMVMAFLKLHQGSDTISVSPPVESHVIFVHTFKVTSHSNGTAPGEDVRVSKAKVVDC